MYNLTEDQIQKILTTYKNKKKRESDYYHNSQKLPDPKKNPSSLHGPHLMNPVTAGVAISPAICAAPTEIPLSDLLHITLSTECP